jgi:hypothetical protein
MLKEIAGLLLAISYRILYIEITTYLHNVATVYPSLFITNTVTDVTVAITLAIFFVGAWARTCKGLVL